MIDCDVHGPNQESFTIENRYRGDKTVCKQCMRESAARVLKQMGLENAGLLPPRPVERIVMDERDFQDIVKKE